MYSFAIFVLILIFILLQAQKCEKTNEATYLVTYNADHEHKKLVDYEDGTTEISFVTTWSYQTSTDPSNAGHDSDIFVVPTIYILIYDVIEISMNANCGGVSREKIKFDVQPETPQAKTL